MKLKLCSGLGVVGSVVAGFFGAWYTSALSASCCNLFKTVMLVILSIVPLSPLSAFIFMGRIGALSWLLIVTV